VFEVTVEAERLNGLYTSRGRLAALRRIAADAARAADIGCSRISSVRDGAAAVVTAAWRRCCASRDFGRPVSEALHGEPLALLERREESRVATRARGDGYHCVGPTPHI